jgi:hypothetical protein
VGSGRAAAGARSGDKSGKKAANLKEMERGKLARLLGIWAILFVALSALVSLIERDRPELLSSGNPFVVGVICASVVTVLFFGFAWLHSTVFQR